MKLYKVWAADRIRKCLVAVKEGPSLYTDLILQGKYKFKIKYEHFH